MCSFTFSRVPESEEEVVDDDCTASGMLAVGEVRPEADCDGMPEDVLGAISL